MRMLKNLARFALHRCGGLAAVRHWSRRGLRILTYHAFPQDLLPSLDRQCEHLGRHYRLVSMAEVAASIGGARPLPANALAVTIDDGYADIAGAQTVFRKHGIPVTVYLVTDFLDHQMWFWWNRILYAFSRSDCRQLEIADQRLTFDSGAQRHAAADAVIEAAKRLPNARRLALCDEVVERLGVRLPDELPPEWRPLSWKQVRELRRDGMEFGAHTVTHPILSTVEDDAMLAREIAGSKRRIEEELGEPVKHFCYPNGQRADIDERTLAAVRQSGFETAVTTEAGVNFRPEPFLLRRFLVDPQQPFSYFAELVAGAHHFRRGES